MSRIPRRRGVVVMLLCVIMLGMSVTILGVIGRRFASIRQFETHRAANRRFDAVRKALDQVTLDKDSVVKLPVDSTSDHWITVQRLDELRIEATEVKRGQTLRQIIWNETGASS